MVCVEHVSSVVLSDSLVIGLGKSDRLWGSEAQGTERYKSSPMSETEGIGLVMLKDSYQFTINPGTSEGNVRCVMDVKE